MNQNQSELMIEFTASNGRNKFSTLWSKISSDSFIAVRQNRVCLHELGIPNLHNTLAKPSIFGDPFLFWVSAWVCGASNRSILASCAVVSPLFEVRCLPWHQPIIHLGSMNFATSSSVTFK